MVRIQHGVSCHSAPLYRRYPSVGVHVGSAEPGRQRIPPVSTVTSRTTLGLSGSVENPLMHEDDYSSADIRTDAALQNAITRLFRTAYENGVSVDGSWEIRNGSGYPDWEAVVYELEKQDSD